MREIFFQGLSLDELAEAIASRLADALTANEQQPAGSLLTDREQTAQLLNISLSSLDKLVKENAVPSINVGSKRLFDPTEAVEALKKCPPPNVGVKAGLPKQGSLLPDEGNSPEAIA